MKRKLLVAGFLPLVVAMSGQMRIHPTIELTGAGMTMTGQAYVDAELVSEDGTYTLSPLPIERLDESFFEYGSVSLIEASKAIVEVKWRRGFDMITVNFSEPCGPCTAALYDMNGKQLFNVKLNGDMGETYVGMKMPVGVYIFTITNQDNAIIYSGKLAKSNK